MLDQLREIFRPKHRLTPEEYAKKLLSKGLHPDGTPILDPVPLAPPVGYKKHPTMVELIRDMVRSERLKQDLDKAGHETFEEAEDFDIGDEPEMARSAWENDFDPPLNELVSAGREAVAEREKVAGVEGGEPPSPSPSPAPPAPPTPTPSPGK